MNDPEKLRALIGNIPLKRLGKSSDIAGVAAFLASSDADYITGTTIVADGGLLWNYEEQCARMLSLPHARRIGTRLSAREVIPSDGVVCSRLAAS